MKTRCLFIFMIVGLLVKVNAQQQPFYTQYVLNPFISNPALAGIESYWDAKMSYRMQWQGIESAPKTMYLTLQGPFKQIRYSKPTTATVAPPEKKKRRSVTTNYWKKYRSIIRHAGFGISLLNDKTGPINRYAANAAYAYHVGLSARTSISAGLAAGIQGVSLDTEQLNFGSANPSDPAVAGNDIVNILRPDMSVGVWLYSAFYFAGVSAQNVIPSKISYSNRNDVEGMLVPHIMLSAGYKIFLNDYFTLLPSTMIRLVSHTPVSFDINTKFQYRDMVWLGASYRHSKSFAGMFGMNINSTLNFGYSYDLTTSQLKSVSTGTHEVVLGILLGNRNKVLCPRDFW